MNAKRLRVALLLSAFLTVLIGLTAVSVANGQAESPPHDHDHDHGNGNGNGNGLGQYGKTGPISRDQLPPGIAEGASGRAIGLAQSPVFAEARENWNLPSDFVHHIDYQTNFRSSYDFLSDEPEAIAEAMTTQFESEHFDDLRLYLTPAEADELTRRDGLGNEMDDLREMIGADMIGRGNSGNAPGNSGNARSTPPAHSNAVLLRQDQQDGGKLIAYVLDGEQPGVRRAVGKMSRSDFEVRVVPYSATEYATFQEELGQRVRPLGIDYGLSLEFDDTLMVTLEVDDESLLPTGVLDGLPSDAVEIVEADGYVVEDAGEPNQVHAPADATAGIRIRTYRHDNGNLRGHCTWGLNGHTNSLSYIVTAGHCFHGGQDITGQYSTTAEINSVSDTHNYTTGRRYILSNDTAARGDMARMSAPRATAGTNCMHWENNPCAWGMEAIARNGTWDLGSDRTCGSFGTSNKRECALIENVGVERNGHTNLATFRLDIRSGDSGTGMHWGETIDGLLILRGTFSNGATDRGYFHTAEDVRAGLRGSFDFNCWHNGQRNRHQNDWLATCPDVNR